MLIMQAAGFAHQRFSYKLINTNLQVSQLSVNDLRRKLSNKGNTMSQWINVHRNSSFTNPTQLPLFCEKMEPYSTSSTAWVCMALFSGTEQFGSHSIQILFNETFELIILAYYPSGL